VANHAEADHVTVRLRSFDDTVHLAISDDGRGFVPSGGQGGAGFGLTSMRERVEGLGGTLLVLSEPGAGTSVVAEVPGS
jgi:signal transduction histidine kinase